MSSGIIWEMASECVWWLVYVAPESNYCRLHANVLFRRNVVGVMGLMTYPADFLTYWSVGIRAGDKRWRVGACQETAGCRSPGAVNPESPGR